MRVDGGCFCGAIKFEAEVDPADVRVCHCTDCQVLSGAPFRAVLPVPREKLKLTGSPKQFVKTAESGNKRVQAFCPECGTPIYSSAGEKDPAVYALRVGVIRQRAQLPPKIQAWHRSAMPWSPPIATVTESYEKGSPGVR